MLKYLNGELVEIESTTLKRENLLEREDLQQTLIKSWQHFTRKINKENLIYVGQEICPSEEVGNKIDILAYDSDNNVPVIIELKRDKNKLQLLQALSYAAMFSSKQPEDLLRIAEIHAEPSELTFDEGEKANFELPSIILLAESYDPEVIITCDWLTKHSNLQIECFQIKLLKSEDSTYFDFNQVYPLPGLAESYKIRRGLTYKNKKENSDTSWEEIKAWITYEWGKKYIDVLKSIKPGMPNHRRFQNMGRQCIQEIESANINFRKSSVNINVYCDHNKVDEDYFSNILGPSIKVRKWKGGYAFNLIKEEEMVNVLNWLGVVETASRNIKAG